MKIKKFGARVDKQITTILFSREGRDETTRSNLHFNAQPLLLANEDIGAKGLVERIPVKL